jgi:hypothetical protein
MIFNWLFLSRQDCCRSVFEMKDAQDNHVLTLRGPLLMCDGPLSCRCENKFTVNEMLDA